MPGFFFFLYTKYIKNCLKIKETITTQKDVIVSFIIGNTFDEIIKIYSDKYKL